MTRLCGCVLESIAILRMDLSSTPVAQSARRITTRSGEIVTDQVTDSANAAKTTKSRVVITIAHVPVAGSPRSSRTVTCPSATYRLSPRLAAEATPETTERAMPVGEDNLEGRVDRIGRSTSVTSLVPFCLEPREEVASRS